MKAQSAFESRIITTILLTCVVILVALRFWDANNVFFHDDGGRLLLIAEDAATHGKWPSHGLVGTKSIHYGPIPSWIYTAMRHVLPNPLEIPKMSLCLNAALQIGSLIYLFWALSLLVGRRGSIIGFALALASPFHLYYTRELWDNTYLIVISNVMFGYMMKRVSTFIRDSQPDTGFGLLDWGVFGLLASCALGTHLMTLPVIAVLFGILFFKTKGIKSRILGPLVAFLVLQVVLFSYEKVLFAELLQPRAAESAIQYSKSLLRLRTIGLKWSGWMSWGEFARYLMGKNYQSLLETYASPVFVATLIGFGGLFQGFWFVGLAAGLGYLWRRRKTMTQLQKVYMCGGLLGLSHVAFSLLVDASNHPHYLQFVWSLPFLFAATIGAHKWPVRIMAGTVLVNTIFAGLFWTTVQRDSGFAGLSLGPSYSRQIEAVSRLCAVEPTAASNEIVIDSVNPGISFANIEWLAMHLKPCRGKSVRSDNVGTRYRYQFDKGQDRWVIDSPSTIN